MANGHKMKSSLLMLFCLIVKRCKNDDLHFPEKCLKDIKENQHNVWDMQELMEVHQIEPIVLTE